MQKKKFLGETLVELGLIDQFQLRAALGQQQVWGKPLGRTLIEMRLVTEEKMIEVLSDQLNIPIADLPNIELDPNALALVDEAFCREHICVPFAYHEAGRFLDVAMAHVQNQETYDTLRVTTRCNIRPYVTGVDAVRDALDRVYRPKLDELELQFQLNENLFDFGDQDDEHNRHVDPAVRRTSSENPAVGDSFPAELSSEWLDSEDSSPAAPEATPRDAATGRAEGRDSLEQQLGMALARLDRLERGLDQLMPQLREFFGQLADAKLIEVRAGHPLLPRRPSPPESPAVGRSAAESPAVRPSPPESPAVGRESAAPRRPARSASAVARDLIPEARKSSPVARDSIPEARKSSPAPAKPAARPLRRGTTGGLKIVERRRPPTSAQGSAVDPRVEPEEPTTRPAPPAQKPTTRPAPPVQKPTTRPAPPVQKPAAASPREPAAESSGPLKTAPPPPRAEGIAPAASQVTTARQATLPLLELPEGAKSVVAMDLGTTRASVASLVDGRISMLKLPGGEWDVPSVVGFRSDGSVVIGEAARKMLATDAENVIASPKRLLGRRFDDPALGPYLAQLGMQASAGPSYEIVLRSRGRALTVVEACSHLLMLLRLVAVRALGHPVEEVILSVPVTFGQRQLRALSAAAGHAGLKVLEVLHEPVAAAMSCIFDASCEGRVAIYDFGGGTFDFSVVEVGEGGMEVVASAGDSWLGGDDLDIALASAAANALWQQEKVEVRNQAHLWQHLLLRAEIAKCELSSREETILVLPNAIRTPQGQKAFEFPITRKQFAKLIHGIVRRSLESCHEALSAQKIDRKSLSAVYLSGGTSYVPAVQQAVAEYFGMAPRSAMPPERMVAVGAAVHGALSG